MQPHGTFKRNYHKHAVLKDGIFGKRYYSIVYAIEAKDLALIKFGRTNNMDKRFRSLSGSSPCKLTLLGHLWMPDDAEGYILQHLEDERSHGEWFYAVEPCWVVARLIASGDHRGLVEEIGLNWIIKDSDSKREQAA